MIRSSPVVLSSLLGLSVAALAACSSTDTAPMIIPVMGSGGTSGGDTDTTGASGDTSSTGGGGDGNATAAGGATGMAGSSSAGGASNATSDGGTDRLAHAQSKGCGTAWTHATGTFVEVAGPATHTNPAPLGPLVPVVGPSDTENRGYWVLVPKNYDPNKAGGYKVIYEGAGCDDPDINNAGKDGYPYQNVTAGDAIQVGLDYDTHSTVPLCYDNRNAESNDFAFMPWLMNQIESDFCVDVNHQFWSGYSSGGWVAQQFDCAFPEKLRGQVAVTGSEPAAQPTCNAAPTAAFFIHDIGDTSNTYQSILPGCSRVLKQNGCSVTDCSNPQSMTLTKAYTLPQGVSAPQGTVCREFNGCPNDFPVVFCTTHLPSTANLHGDQREWAIPTFWDFMQNLK